MFDPSPFHLKWHASPGGRLVSNPPFWWVPTGPRSSQPPRTMAAERRQRTTAGRDAETEAEGSHRRGRVASAPRSRSSTGSSGYASGGAEQTARKRLTTKTKQEEELAPVMPETKKSRTEKKDEKNDCCTPPPGLEQEHNQEEGIKTQKKQQRLQQHKNPGKVQTKRGQNQE